LRGWISNCIEIGLMMPAVAYRTLVPPHTVKRGLDLTAPATIEIDDPLGPARGIVLALALTIPFWIAAALLVVF
jgi:hypothetical protein